MCLSFPKFGTFSRPSWFTYVVDKFSCHVSSLCKITNFGTYESDHSNQDTNWRKVTLKIFMNFIYIYIYIRETIKYFEWVHLYTSIQRKYLNETNPSTQKLITHDFYTSFWAPLPDSTVSLSITSLVGQTQNISTLISKRI